MFALAGCKVPTIKSKSRVLQCVCVYASPFNRCAYAAYACSNACSNVSSAMCDCGSAPIPMPTPIPIPNIDVGLFYVSTCSICASRAYANFKSIDYFKRPAWVRMRVCVFECTCVCVWVPGKPISKLLTQKPIQL